MLDPLLKGLLSEHWGLQNPRLVSVDGRGYSADNLIIEDNGTQYFLKQHNPKREQERLLEIQRLIQYLSSKQVPVICPVPAKDGKGLAFYQNRYIELYPYVVQKEFASLPTKEAVMSLGKALAEFHNATYNQLHLTSKKVDTWSKEGFLDEAQNILTIINKLPEKTDFDKKAQLFLETKIALATRNTATFEDLNLKIDVVCHGDFHYHNVFFNDQDEVSYLLDFERAQQGSRVMDLAYGIFYVCFDANNPEAANISNINFELARDFIEAYTDRHPLSREEIAAGLNWLYQTKIVHMVWPLENHYLKNDTRTDVLLNTRLSQLLYMSEHGDEVMERLLHYTSEHL
jgi:Ser/Thr protein kinase RdoA (MazF antagonist)